MSTYERKLFMKGSEMYAEGGA